MAYSARKACSKALSSSEQKVQKSTRSSTGSYIYSEMCFFCGLRCQCCEDFRKVVSGSHLMTELESLRVSVDLMTGTSFLDVVVDLFAADAVYHQRCYVRFTEKLSHTPHKHKRG